ncbi:MAG: hypothetical protein ACJAS9_003376 [Polaribacter sp.]|jgi:hypothetical protein
MKPSLNKKNFRRITEYPEGFMFLENSEEIIGFINSAATHKVELSLEELIGHDPSGEHIVIMSVVIHPKY